MTTSGINIDARAAAKRRKMMRRVNVIMRVLLSIPFRTPLSSRLMLVTYTGRKTGKRYRQPLSYVIDPTTASGNVLLTPGGGNWTLSLAGGTPVSSRIRGRSVQLRPELVDKPAEVGELLQQMAELNPALVKFVPLPRAEDGTFEPEPLRAAIAHGFRVVRWHRLDAGPTLGRASAPVLMCTRPPR
jgi:hypothetical protein